MVCVMTACMVCVMTDFVFGNFCAKRANDRQKRQEVERGVLSRQGLRGAGAWLWTHGVKSSSHSSRAAGAQVLKIGIQSSKCTGAENRHREQQVRRCSKSASRAASARAASAQLLKCIGIKSIKCAAAENRHPEQQVRRCLNASASRVPSAQVLKCIGIKSTKCAAARAHLLKIGIESSKCAGAQNRHPEQQVRSC
jgi:hypothetical protein